MRLRRVLPALALVAAALAGCQLIAGIDVEEGTAHTDAGVTSPTSDATVVEGPTFNPCLTGRWPSRPAASAGPGAEEDVNIRIFAISEFRIRPPHQPAFGYNLDQRCTTFDSGAPPEQACTPINPDLVVDDDAGIDNVFGRVLDPITLFSDDAGDEAAMRIHEEIEDGNFTVLVFLKGYNGQADDDEVAVALVMSPKLLVTGCAGGGGANPKPKWDGCDNWGNVKGSFQDGLPANARRGGYVSNYTLVFEHPEMSFALGSLSIVKLTNAVVTARIIDGELRDGIVAGRADRDSLVSAAGHLKLDGEGSLGCENPLVLKQIREGCRHPDLPAQPSSDGKGLPCDAVSFAAGFVAKPAKGDGGYAVAPDSGCAGRDLTCAATNE